MTACGNGRRKVPQLTGKQPGTFQLQEYQTDMWRCRFDTPGKLIPAHSAGAHTARGLCVAPGRCVGAELTAAGPPTAQGYPWAVCGPPHQITWPHTAQGPI